MDPITPAIVAALSAGTIAGLTDMAKAAISDSYNKLKGLLTKKYGANSDVVQALKKLEAKPESQGRKEALQDKITALKAEQDDEILTAAKQILMLVHPQQVGMGKFAIQNNAPIGQQNVGDNNTNIHLSVSRYQEQRLTPHVVLIDASLDPHDSPYEQTLEKGTKKIRYRAQMKKEKAHHD